MSEANGDNLDCLVRHVGDRVRVFDARLFVDDRKTPLSVTMQVGTIKHLWTTDDGQPVADVRLDRDGRLSRGHFNWAIEDMPNAEHENPRERKP